MPSPEARAWKPWAVLTALAGFSLVAQIAYPRLHPAPPRLDPEFLTELGYTCSLLLLAQAALLLKLRPAPLLLRSALCLPSALLALLLATQGGNERHARTFLALPPILFLLLGLNPRQKPAGDPTDRVI